jgi:hypothetical protein
MNTQNKVEQKKTYSSPRLETYGDVREISRAVGATGAKDGILQNKTR